MCAYFALFCLSEFWFINIENEFPMIFNTFVKIFWRAECFGYMWVSFERAFNKLCLVFSLEKEKYILSGQKQKTNFLVKSIFSLENLWNIIFFWNFYQGACPLAIGLKLLSGTKLWKKKHQLVNALSRDLKYLDDVELVILSDEFQVCWIFNLFTENEDKP